MLELGVEADSAKQRARAAPDADAFARSQERGRVDGALRLFLDALAATGAVRRQRRWRARSQRRQRQAARRIGARRQAGRCAGEAGKAAAFAQAASGEPAARADNPIAVPAAERAVPSVRRGAHQHRADVTEVIQLGASEGDRAGGPAREARVRAVRRRVGTRARGGTRWCGGRLGSTLVAALVVDKYATGCRCTATKWFQRMGVDLAVLLTLADQVMLATDLMRPLWRTAIKQVLTASVMHLPPTGLPVLDCDAAGGKARGAVGLRRRRERGGVRICVDRQEERAAPGASLGPEEMLAQRTGYTVADASNLFDESFAA